jgi:hypothetical protein
MPRQAERPETGTGRLDLRPIRIVISAETEPRFLDRLQQIFTKHHTLGANEQDYTDTAAYAEQFIQQVVRLRDKERRS